jgi:hypothetical protein
MHQRVKGIEPGVRNYDWAKISIVA